MPYRTTACLLGILLIFGWSVPVTEAVWVWTPKTKKFVNPRNEPKDSPQEQFQFATAFYAAKDYDRAIKEFRKITKHFHTSEEAGEAQYWIGRCYEDQGQIGKAAEEYQKLITVYPYSKRVSEVIERQYIIGQQFLAGEKVKLWKVDLWTAYDKAAGIFEQVVANSPYGEYGPRAQHAAAQAYKKLGEFEQGRKAFQKVVDNYPDSPQAEDARYQVALMALEASFAASYDQASTDRAIQEFRTFLAQHPNEELAREAEQAIEGLTSRKAESDFQVAQFYEQQKRWESARLYYAGVIHQFPETSWAAKAAERLQILEQQPASTKAAKKASRK